MHVPQSYIRAIRISEEMWEFLSDNPTKGKLDFPKYRAYGINDMVADCPLCDYNHTLRKGCNSCILEENDLCTSDIDRGVFGVWYQSKHPLVRQDAATTIWRRIFEERLRIMEWER